MKKVLEISMSYDNDSDFQVEQRTVNGKKYLYATHTASGAEPFPGHDWVSKSVSEVMLNGP